MAQQAVVRATNDWELTLAQRAYIDLKELIVSLALPAGSTLREGELQERLQVGRTPLREALHRLTLDGMLHIYPRRAIVVANLGMPEVRQVFEVRLALETSAAALAADRATPAEITALRALATELGTSRSKVDVTTFLKTDQAFHRAIAAYAQNALLAGYIDHIQSLNLWLWHSYFATRPLRGDDLFEHDPIVAAIAAGDAPAAAAAMGDHIRHSREQLLSRW